MRAPPERKKEKDFSLAIISWLRSEWWFNFDGSKILQTCFLHMILHIQRSDYCRIISNLNFYLTLDYEIFQIAVCCEFGDLWSVWSLEFSEESCISLIIVEVFLLGLVLWFFSFLDFLLKFSGVPLYGLFCLYYLCWLSLVACDNCIETI